MLDLIKKRRSIRKYTDEPITDEQIKTLLEAAMAAPSANNRQPWHFIVVRDAGLKKNLAETHPWAGMAADASVVFVVTAEETRHWVEDCSAATENLLLAVTALDLGAVWVAVYPDDQREAYVRKVLEMPEDLRVLCLVPVGYPAESKPAGTKYKETKVHYDGF
ncbi:MAG: nitroreductase family protein [Anaerolineae bacterium]